MFASRTNTRNIEHMQNQNKKINILVSRFGEQKRWVNWEYEKNNKGEDTKVPYQINGRDKADSTNPLTWSKYEDAIKASLNVGIVFMSDKLLLGIDIDHCLEGDTIFHEQKESIEQLIKEANTYTEISPSNKGLHLFLALTAPLQLIANRKGYFEAYTSGRFFTVTNNPYKETSPVRTVAPDEAKALLSIIGYPWGRGEAQEKNITQTKNTLSLDDATVLSKMFASKSGDKIKSLYNGDIIAYNDDDSSADMALCSHLAFWTGRNAEQMDRMWLDSPLGAREKTQNRKDYRDRTISKAIEEKKKKNFKEQNEIGTLKESKAEWTSTNRPRLWSIGEILKHDFGEEEWLVDSLISKQGMMALSGNPGDFKTWVTIHIALCVSRNLAVFSKFKAVQGSVLIIDEEDHLRLLKKRLELLGAKEADNIHYLSQSGIKIDIEAVRDMILDIVNEKNIKLVIFDSLIRIHQQEENDAGGMAKVFNSFQKIVTAGASILFTHHHRKEQKGRGSNNRGQSMRGSSDILAAVDCHMTIEKKSEEEDRLILRQTKLRQGELLPPFEVNIIKSDLGPSGFEYTGDFDEKKKKAEEIAEAVVLFLANGMKHRTEIIEFFSEDYGRDVVERGIKIAEENEKIERVPKEEIAKENRKKAYYRLPLIISMVKKELPAFLPYIEAGKQEDDRIALKEVEKT